VFFWLKAKSQAFFGFGTKKSKWWPDQAIPSPRNRLVSSRQTPVTLQHKATSQFGQGYLLVYRRTNQSFAFVTSGEWV
jgi:hypothetical protein